MSRRLDVAPLRLLVAPCEQDDEGVAATREVDAIPGPGMHVQFGHVAIDGLSVAEVSFLHRDDPRGDAQSCAAVPQALKPAPEDFGLDDLNHAGIVSTWIRPARGIARSFGEVPNGPNSSQRE